MDWLPALIREIRLLQTDRFYLVAIVLCVGFVFYKSIS